MSEPKRYLVRQNCEYSVVVEAASEDEALHQAGEMSLSDWEQSWSPIEVDEDD